MKTSVPTLAVTCLIFSLVSCSTAKNAADQQRPANKLSGRELNCFIQFTDGTIKQYSSLKLSTGIFQQPHLVADDNVIVAAASVKAYQNKEFYAVSQKEFTSGARSYVATDALPGFAVRIITGRLNVYSLKYYNGHNTTEKLFLQAGEAGQILPCNPDALNGLVKDNNDAIAVLQSKSKTLSGTKKLLAAVDVYNNSKLISKN
jgi:hypothetical protein